MIFFPPLFFFFLDFMRYHENINSSTEREREKPGLLKMFYSNGKLIIDDVFESAKNSLGEEKATKSETESDSTRKKKKKK